MGWEYLWILLIVSAVLCAVGFYKYVYFLSIGYGFAVAGIGAALMILFGGQMRAVGFAQCILFILYGARLSGFLLAREIRSAGYRKTLTEATAQEKGMPFFVKAVIWVFVSILYVAQTSPVFFRQYNGAQDAILPWIGAAICACAIAVEAAADAQKSAQKAKNPNMELLFEDAVDKLDLLLLGQLRRIFGFLDSSFTGRVLVGSLRVAHRGGRYAQRSAALENRLCILCHYAISSFSIKRGGVWEDGSHCEEWELRP